MIVWLNGAFGVGKTAAARELVQLLPDATLYDPWSAGAGLLRMLPKERLAELDEPQDLPAWRRLVVDTAAALLSEVPGPLVAPMSLLRQEHRDEMFGLLAARRIPVRHFLLDRPARRSGSGPAGADEGLLPDREPRVAREETILPGRGDRLPGDPPGAQRAAGPGGPGGPDGPGGRRHPPPDAGAPPWLRADAVHLDVTGLGPRRAARAVADALREGRGACEIVQSGEPSAETVAAGVLLFDEQDRVLLVDPTYKPGWEFPGGIVEPGESPSRAGVREVHEELGLRLEGGLRLLVVDWEPPSRPAFGGLRLLFDGGLLAAADVERLLLPGAELRDWRFVTEAEARVLLPANRHERLRWALRSRQGGGPLNLEAGVPVVAPPGTAA